MQNPRHKCDLGNKNGYWWENGYMQNAWYKNPRVRYLISSYDSIAIAFKQDDLCFYVLFCYIPDVFWK